LDYADHDHCTGARAVGNYGTEADDKALDRKNVLRYDSWEAYMGEECRRIEPVHGGMGGCDRGGSVVSTVFTLQEVKGKVAEIAYRRELRGRIFALEKHMLEMEGSIIDFDSLLVNRFCGGIYCREIHLPKGMLIVAKIHNTEHFSTISQGDVSVLTEFGFERIRAPSTFISPRWIKRVVYVHEDTIWTTWHKTDKTDPKEIEKDVIVANYSELENLENEFLKLALEVK
jgi:hypothetical protein